MITGIGIDMIEVDRVLEKINKPYGFRETIFSAAEIEYCEAQPVKAEHYAARFAAKEAFLKAAGIGLTQGYSLSEIEITRDALGKPSVQLHGAFQKLTGWTKIHLSMSHLRSVASAIVILEQ